MASKTAQAWTGQSDIFNIELVFVCSFLGSLFNHFLTKFWTTFGCLFGCLLGAFSGLLKFSWEASASKNTKKNEGFLRFLKMQLFGSLKLLMALLGSSCPLFGRSGPKMGPKMGPQSGPKSDQKVGQKMTPKMIRKLPKSLVQRAVHF